MTMTLAGAPVIRSAAIKRLMPWRLRTLVSESSIASFWNWNFSCSSASICRLCALCARRIFSHWDVAYTAPRTIHRHSRPIQVPRLGADPVADEFDPVDANVVAGTGQVALQVDVEETVALLTSGCAYSRGRSYWAIHHSATVNSLREIGMECERSLVGRLT